MQQIFDVDTFKALYPKELVHKLFEKNVRSDGRSFEAFRPVTGSIGSIGSASGSCLIRIGNTTVLCGIKMEVACPDVSEPNHGFIGMSRLPCLIDEGLS